MMRLAEWSCQRFGSRELSGHRSAAGLNGGILGRLRRPSRRVLVPESGAKRVTTRPCLLAASAMQDSALFMQPVMYF